MCMVYFVTLLLAVRREWVWLSRVRGQDVKLLKALGVGLICDLMVENKKVKYGLQ